MISFYITEQSIRFASPVIAANALDYLEAKFYFSGGTWDGYSKWAHFRKGETVYDLNLVDDMVKADMHLNLSAGQWEIYVTGSKEESRLTTVPVILTVMESGLVDEPLHPIPQTVAEQVDNKATLALEKATALERAAASGAFNGSSARILGYYESLEELEESEKTHEAGDIYCVGTEPPYSMVVYDGINGRWVDNGEVACIKGERGESGTTFTPQIAENGNLSWKNDGGLENPETVNIMGPKGERGETGSDGKSPYELAAEEGFLGTEETFNWSLANIASHASGHEAGGTDTITVTETMIAEGAVKTKKLEDGAVTREKLAVDAVSNCCAATIGTQWNGEQAPYTQEIELEGMDAQARLIIDAVLAESYAAAQEQLEAWGEILRISPGENKLTVFAESETATAIPIRILRVV